MRNDKSLLRRLLPWLIFLVIAAGLVYLGYLLYSPKPASTLPVPRIDFYEGDNSPLVMENEALRFELNPADTHFTLTEKATGRVWYSNPPEAAQDPIAIAANKEMLQSTLAVTYSSESGAIEFNNYKYSIQNQNFWLEQAEDGSIRVTYAVGQIEKIYMLPNAIAAADFTALTDQMSKADSRKVKAIYTLVKPEKATQEQLSLYPALSEQELYLLKSDTKESTKASNAAIFEKYGYTEEDYARDQLLVAGTKTAENPVFNVTVVYKLDGEDFLVEVPYPEIRYRAAFPITYVTVLPMFGAAGQQEEGFIFLPEGGGALVKYNNGKLNQNAYYANMFGWDYGSERKEVVSETKNTFPVFGMSTGDNSFICVIEGASSYAGVQADISGRYNSYNYVNAKYNVLHADRYNVSAKTANLVYMFEASLPQDTIVQRYRFVNSGSYVDMAASYGDYLREKHPELGVKEDNGDLPVTVELLGAIDKKVVKLGLPVDSVVAVTTFDQGAAILDELLSGGVKNLSARYTGWSNGGVNQKVLTSVNVVGELGGEGAMKRLIAHCREQGVPLYFDGVTTFAYKSGIFQGFIAFRDAARFTTREQIKISPYSTIWYQQDDSQEPFYLVQPSYAKKCAENLVNKLEALGAEGVAFRDIGILLSGDYNPNETTTREQVKAQQVEILALCRQKGQKVMVKEGYDFTLPYVDVITDMDMEGIPYSLIDAEVPFLQMALHGAVSYTGQPINLAKDWQTELLRCAEYGAGLNFTFMAENGWVLQDTFHTGYYGAAWSDWKEDAIELISSYQKEMSGLNAVRMTGHALLGEGVSVTEYADGRKVYVNYRTEDCEAEGLTIPARSYLVTGGEAK